MQPIKRSQSSRTASGIGYLLQKMKKKNEVLKHCVPESHNGNDPLEQQLVAPSTENNNNFTNLPHRKDIVDLEGGVATREVFRTKALCRRDVSDELQNNDVTDLKCDRLDLITALAEACRECRQGFATSKGTVEDTSRQTQTENDRSTEYITLTCTPPGSPPLTHHALSSEIPAGYDFYALDAYHSDPVPFGRMCPQVREIAALQLYHYDLSNLNGQRCLQQHYLGLRTYRWYMESNSDKFACEDCSMSKTSVCMRWLGGNAFLILPLIPKFRTLGLASEDLGYWIWDGVEA
ncbi:hypothetical protein C7974DRAFT_39076 [Boeremia exigua]|uniref:uncharacterized protein n=1 Tax=Boeremia exigua TaxID=749465 RepID=UPI001E8E5489|nr:uncharacterized protein C7974DRAFT_39076 [Boeremia exigua]KAH6618891.1 hypothetical protein C7974DRAFT_39076 [Boeremia exigua]